jgi:putative two-component system response regulator
MSSIGSATMTNAAAAARLLIIDDEPGHASLLERLLSKDGYTVDTAGDIDAAMAAIGRHHPDVILLDVVLPGGDGFSFCRRLKADAATRLTPVIMVTALGDRESRISGRQAGADDFLTKPVDGDELLARVRSLARLKRYTDDLDSAASIVMALAVMIESRDGYLDGRCHRIANNATAIGRAIGLGGDDLQTLHRGGFLHDVGMLAIPLRVLQKQGNLDRDELALVQSHTVKGDELCCNLRSLQPVRSIIRHHHERLDGSGYPDKLRGDEVPLLAQIVGVVDVYDALTTPRPYQETLSPKQALRILRDQVERGWRQPVLVETFASIIGSRWSTGLHRADGFS